MADRVIVFIDDRPGSEPGEITVTVPESSPWFELLPDFQVAEIIVKEAE